MFRFINGLAVELATKWPTSQTTWKTQKTKAFSLFTFSNRATTFMLLTSNGFILYINQINIKKQKLSVTLRGIRIIASWQSLRSHDGNMSFSESILGLHQNFYFQKHLQRSWTNVSVFLPSARNRVSKCFMTIFNNFLTFTNQSSLTPSANPFLSFHQDPKSTQVWKQTLLIVPGIGSFLVLENQRLLPRLP